VLSLILPTFNEAKNLPVLLPKIEAALQGVPHEVIVVDDDSPDRTWEVAQEMGQHLDDLHVIRRVGRRGLSSAVIEGFLSAKGAQLVVMDADGQHDIAVIGKLAKAVQDGAGIAIGSRYIEGGSVGKWDERRHTLSRIATKLAIALCKVKVKDPMSGFFAIDRDLFQKIVTSLNPKGFKILLDLLVHLPRGIKVVEMPFAFAERLHGESKLSRKVQIEFIEYLYDVTFGKYIPLVFVKYCIVGSLGVIVNLVAYMLFAQFARGGGELSVLGFGWSVIGAIEVAIVFNFLLNNLWTFAHVKLKGIRAVTGFLKFNAACLFGALANYAVSSYLFAFGMKELVAVTVGAFTGVVWNYTMSRLFAWKA